jgi:hypothetical protein
MAQKISKKELINLIKEEVKKAIKLKSLNEEKSRIEKQIKLLKEEIDFKNEISTVKELKDFLDNISKIDKFKCHHVNISDETLKCDIICTDNHDVKKTVTLNLTYDGYYSTVDSIEVYGVRIGGFDISDINDNKLIDVHDELMDVISASIMDKIEKEDTGYY